MSAWTFRRAKSLDLCGLQWAETDQAISYPSKTSKHRSIVPCSIVKAGKKFLTSYPLSVATCLPAVKLVCFQTFLIGGWLWCGCFLCAAGRISDSGAPLLTTGGKGAPRSTAGPARGTLLCIRSLRHGTIRPDNAEAEVLPWRKSTSHQN